MKQFKSIVLLLFLLPVGIALAQTPQISLEEIWMMGKFRQAYVMGLRSMNDGQHYTRLERNGQSMEINKYAYKTGEKVETLFSSDQFEEPKAIGDYSFSSDESKLLISTDVEPIYRYSTRSHNYIYDLNSKDLKFISKDGQQRYATFSPQGNKVAYVRDNNLFYLDLATDMETPITQDGRDGKIINGAVDWVYEEEFGFAKGFFWSPDGKRIAFYKFFEEDVKEYNMQVWGSELYPEDYRFKYPKAGEDNSLVEVRVYDLETYLNDKAVSTAEGNYEYIPRVKWSNDPNKLAIQMMNRHQSMLDIYLIDVATGQPKKIYSEKQDTYIEISDDWTFTEDNKTFYITSDKNGFNHVFAVDINRQKEQQITEGDWDITAFHGIDEDNGYIYYTAARPNPMSRQVFRVRTNGKKEEQLTKEKGWNSADFSENLSYFINTHSTINQPNTITLHDAPGKLIRELNNSNNLTKYLTSNGFTEKSFFQVPLDEADHLNAWMLTPTDFDSTKKYPVLLTIYGGPGSQEVTDQWGGANHMWHHYLASKGYIVVSVDNRGTGGRGRDFRKQTYKELGKLETEDYITTAQYLSDQAYVDSNRIGIWGWSYGGYMASLAITKGAEHFKSAIAVAPVTNWRFYDNIYTERYMQTPQENEAGYDENSPINHVDKLEGNYLLIHGTGDDNVHIQNTMQMVNALIRANKHFDLYIYPDRNHGIYGGNTRYHLYQKMSNWLEENL